MAAQTSWKRRAFRPLWATQEQALVDRFTREFVRGRFSTTRAAAEECKRELDRLHARRLDAVWASAPRTLPAVRARIYRELSKIGDTWTGADFLTRENEAIDHYAREFMKGRYRHLNFAALDCWRALKHQADVIRRKRLGLIGTPAPRSLKAVASQIEMRTRAMGRARISRSWSAVEIRTVDKWMRRYVSALEQGIGPSQSEALDAMSRDLETRGYPPRPAAGYRGMFEKRLRTTPVGRSRPGRQWTPADIETARRWVRVYLAARRGGAEFFHTEAASGLRAELARHGHPRTQRGCEGMIERLIKAPRRRGLSGDYR